MENMNYLDLVLGGIVVLSALIGLARGLVKEVLSLIAWAIAIYVAWRFAEPMAQDHIRQFIDDALISYLAAFGILFLVTLFVVGLLNMIIAQILTSTGLSGFDRFLGMLFGLARGLVIGALVVFVIGLTPLTKENWWSTSRLAPGFESVGAWGWERLPPNVRQLLRNGGDTVAEASNQLGISADQSGVEQTGQSDSADRPGLRVSGEQRNAISDMSDAELRLESLSNEHPDNQVAQPSQPPLQQQAQPAQPQPSQPDTNDVQSDQQLSPPPLQLESVQ